MDNEDNGDGIAPIGRRGDDGTLPGRGAPPKEAAMRVFLALAALLPAACAARSATMGDGAATNMVSWRSLATADDRKRLRDWRSAWVEALGKAKATHAAEVAKEGDLLDPDAAALGDVTPPPGDYRCRAVKLGGQSPQVPDYVSYGPFPCRVGPAAAAAGNAAAPAGPGDAGALPFAAVAGPQRPVGRFFPDTPRRIMFLGTLQLGDEKGILRYGHDKERDLAGLLQRIGERRWRLVLPKPHFESTLDVVEIVPVR
ncbi:MAG: hypothetical protein QOG84_2859 [Sphingomonadales bacterium]|nr:hypothetical protein [Sphingomonadales bacterium]